MASARDEIWDTLKEHFGEPKSQNMRSVRGKAINSLLEIGATPDEIERRLANASPPLKTVPSLVKRWDELDQPSAPVEKPVTIRQAYEAFFPGHPFVLSVWKQALGDFSPEEIINAFERIAYTSPFPPGAGAVRVKLINQRLGEAAPLSPEEALMTARQRQAEVAAGLSHEEGLDEIIAKAWRDMKKLSSVFDDKIFLQEYRKQLEEFYATYGRS